MKQLTSKLIILLAACSAPNLLAQQTWNGSVGQNWTTAENWNPSGVPSGAALTFGSATNYTVNLENATRSVLGVTFNSSQNYLFNNGGSSGLLSFGSGNGITQNGAGNVTFETAVAFTGNSRTIGGTGSGSITFNGSLSRTGNGLTFSGANEVILGGGSTNSLGTASITISSGTLTLAKTGTSAQNTALGTGQINFNGGTLKVSNSDAALSNAILIGGNITFEASKLLTLSGTTTISNNRTITYNNTAKLTHAGPITTNAGSGSRTLTLAGTGEVDFTGVIQDGANATVAISKTGSGIVSFSGTNTYTGATTISAGTLLVNGRISGTGPVTIEAGATLSGTGSVSGATTISGAIAPGNSIGTLTITNDTTWKGAASASTDTNWKFELGSSNLSDKLEIGGDFLKDSAQGSTFQFDFLNTGILGTFELIHWTGTTSFSATDFSFTNLGAGYAGNFAINGNNLVFTVVPEGGTTMLLGVGIAGMMFAGWLRKSRFASN